MTPVGVALVVIEIAIGIAAQASGVGGPVATGAALVLAALTAAFLLARGRRRSLAEGIHALLDERRATAPSGAGARTLAEYDRNTVECFRRRHGRDVRARMRKFVKRGRLGAPEAARLGNPTSVAEIEQLAGRLGQLEAL